LQRDRICAPHGVFGANAVSFVAVLGAVALLPDSRAAGRMISGSIGEGVRYVFGQRSLASMMILMLLAGIFGTPPVAFMIPAIARMQLHGGPGTLGALMGGIGLGSMLGAVALLALARRPNKGEPLFSGFLVTGLAIAAIGVSSSLTLSIVLSVVGGFCGVLFVGLSTVVVQAMSSNELRAWATAIWAAAFVGMLPFGALLTAGLAAWLGPGDAVLVDRVAVVVGAIAVRLLRPEIGWLGCAALPEACIAGQAQRPSRSRRRAASSPRCVRGAP
jgi:Transmembrane secretion effector